ncbi:DUF5709 domain-containing protein [Streptomyces sp. NPDC002221]|uniref:DUF5709 domain-containing protein n=1 Tax=Streptomyces sp. NPDC002221 TaxID=3364639 RepID=UPI0036BFEF5A
MAANDDRGDDVYQPDGGDDVVEDTGILDPEDTLNDRGADPYDEGWSPPERPLAVNHVGTTAQEQHDGESLDQRLAEEVPDPEIDLGDDEEDQELADAEVGDQRAGRLVAPDEGAHEDAEKDMLASDMGIDGAGASAEEAAVHLIDDAEGAWPEDERP